MAPVKFGLFRARSREQSEQPSTENLLQDTGYYDTEALSPGSPLPSTSKGFETRLDIAEIHLQQLQLDSDDDETISEKHLSPKISYSSKESDEAKVNYEMFRDQVSTDATSISTFEDEDYEHIEETSDPTHILDQALDETSTTYDVNSIKYDGASLAASEDTSVTCGILKKDKKQVLKAEMKRRDSDMWLASDYEVTQHLLNRTGGNLGDKYKWEAIATARGLCALTDSCQCLDCLRNKEAEAAMADGDAGMGAAAPVYSAMSIGLCSLQ